MPRRTNDFQSLILSIEKRLAGTDVVVTESKELKDKATGRLREIDIFLEGHIAGHHVAVAVECRDHTRKQSVEWIEQIAGKFRDLPINKVVAVSSSGFTNTALTKARKYGIATFAFEEAHLLDWNSELKKASGITIGIDCSTPALKQLFIIHNFLPDKELKGRDTYLVGPSELKGKIYSSEGETRGNLAELLNSICSNTQIFEAAKALGNHHQQAKSEGEITQVLIHKLDEQLTYQFSETEPGIQFDAVGFHLQFEFNSYRIPLAKKIYRNTLIAEGRLNEGPLRLVQTSDQETLVSGLLEAVLAVDQGRPMPFSDIDFLSILEEQTEQSHKEAD